MQPMVKYVVVNWCLGPAVAGVGAGPDLRVIRPCLYGFHATPDANRIATETRGGSGTAAPAPGGGSGAIIFALGKYDWTGAARLIFTDHVDRYSSLDQFNGFGHE